VPSLDELVSGLWKGVKKIEVLKTDITEPLEGWKTSKLALPEPGSKGSMRKGRLHAHDHGESWEVHLDHYDPDANPIKHLIIDAPVLIFLQHFLIAAAKGAGEQMQTAAEEGLLMKYRSARSWIARMALGLTLTVLGLLMLLDPLITLYTAELLITLAIFGMGILVFYSAFARDSRKAAGIRFLTGVLLVGFGVISYYRPAMVFALFLLFLAFWMLVTAYFIFKDRRKGEGLEGTGSLILGLVSLIIGVLTIVEINIGALFFLYFITAIILAFGISQILFAFRAMYLPKTEVV
jgi:uncharacterized membrane protein HdeD (DUF308 family)